MKKECNHNKKNSNKIKRRNRKQEEGNITNKAVQNKWVKRTKEVHSRQIQKGKFCSVY